MWRGLRQDCCHSEVARCVEDGGFNEGARGRVCPNFHCLSREPRGRGGNEKRTVSDVISCWTSGASDWLNWMDTYMHTVNRCV